MSSIERGRGRPDRDVGAAPDLMGFRDSVGVALKRFLYDGVGRDTWQQPERVIGALGLGPGDEVADLGSGTGYFTFRLAREVQPAGEVWAVDTDRALLAAIGRRAAEEGVHNVETVEIRDELYLPHPVDLIFLSNVYHHLPEQTRYFADVRAVLKPGGRVAILESRPAGLFARLFGHATDPAVVRGAMERAGYRLVASHDFVERRSFQIFTPSPDDGPSAQTDERP
jgi:arsenite methyltransferase